MEKPGNTFGYCPAAGFIWSKEEKIMAENKNRYQGTKTQRNLEAAFAGESQARNKYTYFASKAKKASNRSLPSS